MQAGLGWSINDFLNRLHVSCADCTAHPLGNCRRVLCQVAQHEGNLNKYVLQSISKLITHTASRLVKIFLYRSVCVNTCQANVAFTSMMPRRFECSDSSAVHAAKRLLAIRRHTGGADASFHRSSFVGSRLVRLTPLVKLQSHRLRPFSGTRLKNRFKAGTTSNDK